MRTPLAPKSHVVLAALLLCYLIAPGAGAQCPPAAPVNLVAVPGACNALITWTPPPGGGVLNYFVYRGTTATFAGAQLVGATPLTALLDVPPSGSFDNFYWVRSMPYPTACAQLGAIAGPAVCKVRTVDPPVVTAISCAAARVSWPLLRDAHRYSVRRYYRNPSGNLVLDGTLDGSATVPPFIDTSGIPGARYSYVVFPESNCGGSMYGYPTEAVFPASLSIEAVGAYVSVGGTATLTAVVPSSDPGITFRWFYNGNALVNSSRYSGVTTTQLRISGAIPADEGTYTVVGNSTCGTDAATAVLAVAPPPCPADFNQTGGLTVQDLFDFLAAYFRGC